MSDGEGCQCGARYSGECACQGVSWDSEELEELRKENRDLKAKLAVVQDCNAELVSVLKSLQWNYDAAVDEVIDATLSYIQHSKD